MKMNKTDTFKQRVLQAVDVAKSAGSIHNDEYLLVVNMNGASQWDIHVIEKETDMIVAYSSMKGDFETSLQEFVEDFIV